MPVRKFAPQDPTSKTIARAMRNETSVGQVVRSPTTPLETIDAQREQTCVIILAYKLETFVAGQVSKFPTKI